MNLIVHVPLTARWSAVVWIFARYVPLSVPVAKATEQSPSARRDERARVNRRNCSKRRAPCRRARARLGVAYELEVFTLLATGRTNGEIAAELVLGETTVKTHVTRILMKLGVRDRVQAVVLTYETGMVTSSSARHRSAQDER